MASTKRAKPKPKKVSPAEKKRREMAKKKHKTPPKSPMAKKKITNKEAGKILTKEAKARAIERKRKALNKQNKPQITRTNKNIT